MRNEIIPNIGNYKNLLTYQKAVIIYDITYYFCKNYLEKKDRTVDQMIHGYKQWEDNSVEKQKMRAIASNPDNDNFITVIAKSRSPDVIANMMIVLLYQEDYLLYKFLQVLDE